MTQLTRAELNTEANVIKNNTADNSNTATLVGQMLNNLSDSQFNLDDDSFSGLTGVTGIINMGEAFQNVDLAAQGFIEGREVTFRGDVIMTNITSDAVLSILVEDVSGDRYSKVMYIPQADIDLSLRYVIELTLVMDFPSYKMITTDKGFSSTNVKNTATQIH
jgi:hypothetical protein